MSENPVSETCRERILESEVSSCTGKKQTLLFDRYTNTITLLEIPSRSNYLDSFGRRSTLPITFNLKELLCVRTSPAYIRGEVPIRGDATDSNDSSLCFIYAFKKDQNCLRLKQLQVKFKSDQERDEWKGVLTAAMKCSDRPKNIVVFINPFGGMGKALSIFEQEVEPIFKLIESLHYGVLITQRANHARDYIMEEMPAKQWNSVDSLLSVGGDGLFNEVLSGALIRTQQEAGIPYDKPEHLFWEAPHVRFGIIGAGSTNSIARTVHGIHDPTTAALHIVLGLERKMDICSVHGDNHLLRISANAIAYCWTGDLLRDSERYRYLGPARYELSAVRTTLRHPTYKGKVSFSLSPEEAENSNQSPCLPPCKECESSLGSNHQKVFHSQYDHHWHNEFTHIICYVIPTYISYFPYPLAPSTGVDDGTLDLILVPKISRLHNVQFMKNLAIYGGKEVVKLDWATQYFRVHRWSFEPDDNEADTGVWNVDGEILEQPKNTALHFRLHPRLINIFGHESSTNLESEGCIEDERF
ncbi:unnamed protein product [Cylicocyclus nassatus]|uniref:DAGKc domain-containing protein n=1 Tax=Cylicocyclus nassatus TaxID=53992 RepID=A0AA36GLF8_CYLNA|nr:unnamed protein product [Cylicocyclus nassatus]